MAQQIEMIGPRHWLGLMAGAIVASDARSRPSQPADPRGRRPATAPIESMTAEDRVAEHCRLDFPNHPMPK